MAEAEAAAAQKELEVAAKKRADAERKAARKAAEEAAAAAAAAVAPASEEDEDDFDLEASGGAIPIGNSASTTAPIPMPGARAGTAPSTPRGMSSLPVPAPLARTPSGTTYADAARTPTAGRSPAVTPSALLAGSAPRLALARSGGGLGGFDASLGSSGSFGHSGSFGRSGGALFGGVAASPARSAESRSLLDELAAAASGANAPVAVTGGALPRPGSPAGSQLTVVTRDGSVVDSADGLVSAQALSLVQEQQSVHGKVLRAYERRRQHLDADADSDAAIPGSASASATPSAAVSPAATRPAITRPAAPSSGLARQLQAAAAAAAAAAGDASGSSSGGESPQNGAIERPADEQAPSPMRTPELESVRQSVQQESARKDAELVRAARKEAREAYFNAIENGEIVPKGSSKPRSLSRSRY